MDRLSDYSMSYVYILASSKLSLHYQKPHENLCLLAWLCRTPSHSWVIGIIANCSHHLVLVPTYSACCACLCGTWLCCNGSPVYKSLESFCYCSFKFNISHPCVWLCSNYGSIAVRIIFYLLGFTVSWDSPWAIRSLHQYLCDELHLSTYSSIDFILQLVIVIV